MGHVTPPRIPRSRAGRPARPGWWIAFALALGGLRAAPAAADIAVVTGESTPVEALETPQVRDLWLGTIERVGAAKVYVVDRSDEAIRHDFYRLVLHKTRGQVKAIRAKRAFQHAIAPPPELPDDASVSRWVLARENRLGYVDAGALADPANESLKVLLLIQVPERSGGE